LRVGKSRMLTDSLLHGRRSIPSPPAPRQAGIPQVTPQVTPEVRLLLDVAGEAKSRQALQSALALKDAKSFRRVYLQPALEAGWIEMTIPDKPRSSKQRYRITPLGREVLKKTEGRR